MKFDLNFPVTKETGMNTFLAYDKKKTVSIAFGISFLREIKNRRELYISFIQTYLSSVMKTQ